MTKKPPTPTSITAPQTPTERAAKLMSLYYLAKPSAAAFKRELEATTIRTDGNPRMKPALQQQPSHDTETADTNPEC